MIRWTDTLEIKNCSSCPFHYSYYDESVDDDTLQPSDQRCNLMFHYKRHEYEIKNMNDLPDFCPLLENNIIVRVEEKIKTKKK